MWPPQPCCEAIAVGHREVGEEAVALSRQIGDLGILGFSVRRLGLTFAAQGEYRRAWACYEKAIEACSGHELSVAWNSAMLGFL